jgi:HAD superfamily hydrolase (TIGR01509 family)
LISTIIFDLDGTLVQTEILKAYSYARAVAQLSCNAVAEKDVVEVFKEVVGRSRQEVAQRILEYFDLEKASRRRIPEFLVDKPWQVFVQIRLKIYESMLNDPELLRKHQCPYNIALLERLRKQGCRTGLATMSHCPQANRVLKILNLQQQFNFIATRDDVEQPKPDPEIYLLVARELGVPPQDCLVIEDSPSGIKAALAANMACIAVTTDLTQWAVHESGLLEDRWIVTDPRRLLETVQRFLRENGKSCGS